MAAGAIGAASQAEAALYYWSDYDPGYSRPAPPLRSGRKRLAARQSKKIEAPARKPPSRWAR